jgi:hypothetical protein
MMMMKIQTTNRNLLDFDIKARKIRSQAATILQKWGLLPRFKRWRLTQDPETGMIVLFGILNAEYIAKRTSTPFADYFDSRVLHDLANELQVEIVSCNADGQRYAFILDRGQVNEAPPRHFSVVDNGRVFAKVNSNSSRFVPSSYAG